MKINPRSNIPLHRQIEDEIRKLVASGNYQNGELLPKEMDIAIKLNVARNTVRQAINKMVIEGTLLRKKGVGTTVASKTLSTNLGKWHSFTGEMNEQGIHLVNHFNRVSTEVADETIAARLKIKKGTKVVKLERLRGTADVPFVFFISWLHPRLGVSLDEDFSSPLYQLLEQKYAAEPYRSCEELSAVASIPGITTKLQLPKNAPLLCRKRVVSDKKGQIIEYNIGYYDSNKFLYKIDVLRD